MFGRFSLETQSFLQVARKDLIQIRSNNLWCSFISCEVSDFLDIRINKTFVISVGHKTEGKYNARTGSLITDRDIRKEAISAFENLMPYHFHCPTLVLLPL